LPPESVRAAGGEPYRNAPLEAYTTLAAVASWTSRVKLGTEVTPMTMRPPPLLAKMTSTLDVLSNGRFILGAGAGWFPEEFKSFGLIWYRLDHRFEAMYESIDVVTRLWTQDVVDYDGLYYKLKQARLFPKPLQKPHPPIWIGGQSDRILRSVIKYGSGWIPANNTSPEEYKTLIGRLRMLAAEVGRDSSEITLAGPFLAQIGRDYEAVRRSVEEYSIRAMGSKAATSWNVAFSASIRYGIWGTPEDCVKRIEQYIRLGVQHFILDLQPPTTSLATVELLCGEIIPHLRRR
jgi:alkanesulfonate monooxygenase